jgi:serine protease Do
MPKLSPSRRPAARALALPFAALAAAALGNACSRADGPADHGRRPRRGAHRARRRERAARRQRRGGRGARGHARRGLHRGRGAARDRQPRPGPAAARLRGDPAGDAAAGFQVPREQQRGPARGSGSGFIVSPDGYILTNNHVVEGATRIRVTLTDRRIFDARVIGRDDNTDVALIKIDATGLPVATLGDDRQVQVGQPVIAIGNPLGLRSTVTTGIISAKERGSDLNGLLGTTYSVADFLQTDAVINPGNSGGPLVDLAGRVIGINSAIESPTGVYAGYGFAVPVGIARTAMEQFLKYGRVRRAILGVGINDVRAADAQAAGLREIRGALVGSVQEDGGARAAGLQPGDIILSVDNQPISSVAVLQRTIYGYQPGQTVNGAVQRFGTPRAGARDAARRRRRSARRPPRRRRRAARRPSPAARVGFEPLTPAIAQSCRCRAPRQGLVVRDVDPSGPAAGSSPRATSSRATWAPAGQRPVRAAGDLASVVTNAPNGVVSLLVVGRGGGGRVVNIGLTR